MIAKIEEKRLSVSRKTKAEHKSRFGQYFTPQSIAKFMVGLFPSTSKACKLLDAGAGIGSLSTAFLERWAEGDGFDFAELELDTYELDSVLIPYLNDSLESYRQDKHFQYRIHETDFILETVRHLTDGLFSNTVPSYTHVILNPPYKKIASSSLHRKAMDLLGVRTVNLYTAFLVLSLELCLDNANLVAIIPRSFCSGNYYRPFREYLLKNTAIKQIHLFESRTSAFKNDQVLQENIILHLEKNGQQGDVTISRSTDERFEDIEASSYSFDKIIFEKDAEKYFHIPRIESDNLNFYHQNFRCTLDEIGIQVSTGPVVDFRLREHLRPIRDYDCVPLLYPCHFKGAGVTWPLPGSKKPNAIHLAPQVEKWLYPSGNYCVVRRLSSKEEKKRIVASFVSRDSFPEDKFIGFENHLNVFHFNKCGLPELLARGLSVFLNSSIVDEFFRGFNGHTQVNATDLRQLKYPDRETLIKLGEWSVDHPGCSPEELDRKVVDL